MKLPEVRKRLYELAEEYKHDIKLSAELKKLADEIKRRPPIMRAKRSSREMTPEIARRVKIIHRLLTKFWSKWSVQKTANFFNLNIGRVSEAVRGKRQ